MEFFSIWHWIVLLIILPLAFLPTIIGIRKNHPYKIPIALLNILGGLVFGLGWLAALIWCFILPNASRTVGQVADELELLHQLKSKGIINQEEFDYKKKEILS